MDQDIKEIILTFGGVGIGFLLSEGASLYRTRSDVTNEGEAFDFDIASYKPLLEEQISELKKYRNQVLAFQQDRPALIIMPGQRLSAIDRHKVIKYYSRKRDRKESLRLLSLRLNRMEIIHTEIERFTIFHEEFIRNLEKILAEYGAATNKFAHEIAECYRKWYAGDEYSLSVLQISQDLVKNPVYNIVSRKPEIHEKLMKLDANRDHKYHDAISQFNTTGLAAIADFENQIHEGADNIDVFIKSLSICYKDVYGN